ALVDREREGAVLDQQVVVRRRDVDAPRLDRLLVGGLDDGHRREAAEQVDEGVLERLRRAVLRDRDRRPEGAREAREQVAQGGEPAPRGSDDDELEAFHATYLIRL